MNPGEIVHQTVCVYLFRQKAQGFQCIDGGPVTQKCQSHSCEGNDPLSESIWGELCFRKVINILLKEESGPKCHDDFLLCVCGRVLTPPC